MTQYDALTRRFPKGADKAHEHLNLRTYRLRPQIWSLDFPKSMFTEDYNGHRSLITYTYKNSDYRVICNYVTNYSTVLRKLLASHMPIKFTTTKIHRRLYNSSATHPIRSLLNPIHTPIS
jgi:hypothetical protein